MSKLSPAEYQAILRSDLGFFAERCFYELNPQTAFLMNWHIEVIAAKLTAVREGRIRRLIINLPPRHLKSLLASVAFPAWCLGHDPSAQILCVSYAQDLADKLARDCRSIMMSSWYRRSGRNEESLLALSLVQGNDGSFTMLAMLRVVGATELGLVICEGVPGLHNFLPLGGTHLAQIGILFGSTAVLSEWVEIVRLLRHKYAKASRKKMKHHTR
jgi:hypothetical protein